MAHPLQIDASFIDGATSDGDHPVTDPDGYFWHYFYCQIDGTATVTAKASVDGTNYVDAADGITEDGLIIVDGVYPYLKLTISGASSVTVDVQHAATNVGRL